MPTMVEPSTASALAEIREKVVAGQRLSFADGMALFQTRDIFSVGELATIARERRHRRRAFFNINRHINYTNYCVLRCKFCSFYRPYAKDDATNDHAVDGALAADPTVESSHADAGGSLVRGPHERDGGYEYSVDEIVRMAAAAQEQGATEVHIVGGLHPRLPFEFYADMCRAIKAACPGLHIKAFTAIEIVHFTRISKPRKTIAEVLIALREAGLDSLPGGGAEIFDDRVHAEAFKAKVGEKHWFDVHRTAHDLGIPSNATMLYGHIETVAERVQHLIKLREHQDVSLENARGCACRVATTVPAAAASAPMEGARFCPHKAAFQCCIPLSFIPDGSEFGDLPGPTGLDDLRTLAVSRLMLDNFDHIKAFWIMQTPKLSQVALNWGVDDFDGTVVWYDITKREGHGTNHQELSVDQIRRLMREAGCEPIERDTLYRPVRRDASGRVVRS